jgi:ABC-type sulfate transport system permease component
MMKTKILRILAFFLAVFFLVSAAMLFSPLFSGIQSVINGMSFLVFAFFLVRYSFWGRQLGRKKQRTRE